MHQREHLQSCCRTQIYFLKYSKKKERLFYMALKKTGGVLNSPTSSRTPEPQIQRSQFPAADLTGRVRKLDIHIPN